MPQDLREIILKKLEREGSTVYELAAQAAEAGVCHRSTVYRYLTEKKAISADVVEWILGECSLKVRA